MMAPEARLTPPGDLRCLLLIARRGAIEALRDRLTLIMSLVFALIVPTFMVLAAVRPLIGGTGPEEMGRLLAFYLLIVGLLPSSAAIGIASGQFAGEKEQGSLTPLLASPASNVAIFGGKILGAIIPTTCFALVAEAAFLTSLTLVVGLEALLLIPLALALTMLALVPTVSLFTATVASLISSRVRTYNAAQQIGGLALLPFWGGFFTLAFRLVAWGPAALLAAVVGLLVVDGALLLLAANTWRREDVLAQR